MPAPDERLSPASWDHRRSQRLLLDLPVVVRGNSGNQAPFEESTFTVVVNAHGALIMLAAKVGVGEKVVVVNPATKEELEGSVAYRGREYAGMTKVAVEFNRPSPGFWHIPSPPDNWKNFGS